MIKFLTFDILIKKIHSRRQGQYSRGIFRHTGIWIWKRMIPIAIRYNLESVATV